MLVTNQTKYRWITHPEISSTQADLYSGCYLLLALHTLLIASGESRMRRLVSGE